MMTAVFSDILSSFFLLGAHLDCGLPGMDGWIKSGRGKISARGPQIRPNVQHTDEELKICLSKLMKRADFEGNNIRFL
jgi:hypothetical protein